MELQILISKKGTKVVTATNLYLVLKLPNSQFRSNVKKWLNDYYEFSDGIRKPERFKDFSTRKIDDSIVNDYYLSVEFAKLLCLKSKSKVKAKYARWLYSLEETKEQKEQAELLTIEQVQAVMELTKVMSLMSCQESAEKQHFKKYEEESDGDVHSWWKYRANLLGYSMDKLKDKMKRLGKPYKGQSSLQMLMKTDKYETIRTSVIDIFVALGKTDQYARNLGDLAKVFAKEMNVEIWDDRKSPGLFNASINPKLAQEVKVLKRGDYLGLW